MSGVLLLRFRQHGPRRPGFHAFAVVHDDDVIGKPADDAKIMADQKDRQAKLGLQSFDQGQDGFLYGDIQSGSRLVGNQDLGIIGQRHGNHDALALATT